MMTMRRLIDAVEHRTGATGRVLFEGFLDDIGKAWDERIARGDLDRPPPAQAAAQRPAVKRARPQGFKSGPFEQFYRKVVADGGMMFGADESELDRDAVKEWVKTHRKLFQKGTLTVWRTMQVPPDFVANLKPGADLGNHWTFEFDDGNIEGFNVSPKNKAKGEFYVFEATIETGDVVFPLTVAYNVYFPHENEIFLHSRMATPKLVSIRRFDTDTWTLDDENLRPDLIGAEMRA